MVAAADAAEAAVTTVGEDAAEDDVEVDAPEGEGGEAEEANAPRGAFKVDRMSSRMVGRGVEEEEGGHAHRQE